MDIINASKIRFGTRNTAIRIRKTDGTYTAERILTLGPNGFTIHGQREPMSCTAEIVREAIWRKLFPQPDAKAVTGEEAIEPMTGGTDATIQCTYNEIHGLLPLLKDGTYCIIASNE